MDEVNVKNNTLGVKVFINEKPSINSIPINDLNLLVSELELYISTKLGK